MTKIIAGSIVKVKINDVPFSIGVDSTATIKTSVYGQFARNNKAIIATDGVNYCEQVTHSIETAGVEKIELYVTSEQKQMLDVINNFSMPVTLAITTADGSYYYGEKMYLENGISFDLENMSVTLSFKGARFELTPQKLDGIIYDSAGSSPNYNT